MDQSRADAVATVVADLPSLDIRRLANGARNLAVAYNVGVSAAREPIVAITNDDCTVATDWLEVGVRTVAARDDLLATGRVLPDGDAELVPSCKTSDEAREYRGEPEVSLLFAANMVVHRSELLAIGGFDEGFAGRPRTGTCASAGWARGGRCATSRR